MSLLSGTVSARRDVKQHTSYSTASDVETVDEQWKDRRTGRLLLSVKDDKAVQGTGIDNDNDRRALGAVVAGGRIGEKRLNDCMLGTRET